MGVHEIVFTSRLEGKYWEGVLLSHHVGPSDQTQIVRLGGIFSLTCWTILSGSGFFVSWLLFVCYFFFLKKKQELPFVLNCQNKVDSQYWQKQWVFFFFFCLCETFYLEGKTSQAKPHIEIRGHLASPCLDFWFFHSSSPMCFLKQFPKKITFFILVHIPWKCHPS